MVTIENGTSAVYGRFTDLDDILHSYSVLDADYENTMCVGRKLDCNFSTDNIRQKMNIASCSASKTGLGCKILLKSIEMTLIPPTLTELQNQSIND